MINSWAKEVAVFLVVLFCALILGLITGHALFVSSLALFLYSCFFLFQLYRLMRWIEKKQFSHLPETGGAWGEIYYGIYTLNELSKRHKRHMGNILNQYRKTTETLPDATIIIDSQNQIISINKAARKFFNLIKGDYGRRIDNILRHPEFSAYLDQKEHEKPLRFDYRSDRHYVFQLRLLPYQDDQRLLIARDITQLAQMETSQYDLITNTSHELKTPLTVIRGYIEGLLESESIAHKRHALRQMDQQTLRLLSTINDFLTICKLSEQHSTIKARIITIPTLLKLLVEQAKSMYGTLTHHLTLNIQTDKNIVGIESEIRSAFENLISNAIHYTDNNGVINITWGEQDSQTLYLKVEDNGIGIPQEALNRITERFYRAQNHHNKHGSGLGLSIVKKVLDKHHGQLTIQSKVGQGSSFTCTFPQENQV